MSAESDSVGLLIRLLSAHLLSDFIVQPSSWVSERRQRNWKSRRLYLHGAIAAVAAYVAAWQWSAAWIIPAVMVSHVAIDCLKASASDNTTEFLLDQAAHIGVLVGCWSVLSPTGIRLLSAAVAGLMADPRVWLVVFSYLFVFWPAGILVGKVTAPLRSQLARDREHSNPSEGLGLDRAGLWIGRLERLLILTFMLITRFEAIGFLIAAKSILRFGEGGTPGRRKETEYILIGTLLSFTLAVGVGLLCHYAVRALAATGAA